MARRRCRVSGECQQNRMLNFLLIFLVSSVVVAALFKINRAILLASWLLGFLLPIDYVDGFAPIIFDVCRYALLLVLALRLETSFQGRRYAAVIVCYLLISYNLLLYIVQAVQGGGFVTSRALVGIGSVFLAFAATRNGSHNRILLLGFVTGCTISAMDILAQVAGLPYLGTPTDWGARYAGLSFNSTNTAPFLAVAALVVLSRRIWSQTVTARLFRLISFLILLGGLVLTGGRGGLAGFLVGASAYLLFLIRRSPGIGLTGLLLVISVTISQYSAIVDFLTREGGTGGFTTGRDVLNAQAWDAFWQGGIFGVSVTERDLYRPHTPLLTFALDVGPWGLLVAIASTVALFYRLIRPARPTSEGEVASMMAGVLVTTALLEPVGFFVGAAKAVVLMIVLRAAIGGFQIMHHKPGVVCARGGL